METLSEDAQLNSTLKCKGCGAILHFKPGTENLQCDYCGQETHLDKLVEEANDQPPVDFDEYLEYTQSNRSAADVKMASCSGCGSTTALNALSVSDQCPFCGSPLVLDPQKNAQFVKPHYVLPFVLAKGDAVNYFSQWLKSSWWTPGDLAKKANQNAASLVGMYLPYWLYDTIAETDYSGERGDYYYTTETYTVTVDGEDEVRTREVSHTAWSYASGHVTTQFQDILIPGSQSLPTETLNALEPWVFEKSVAFDERYLAGFRSETYVIDPKKGFDLASQRTVGQIQGDIRDDIGGDEQRINNEDIDYTEKKVKQILLPVWASSYRYKDKVYQFTVNATTGEVIGKRPKSIIKITLLVLFILAVIAFVIFFLSNQ